MVSDCPRLVIAGSASGVGKTSLAVGLAYELTRRGLRVQTFKVGPDFLDPTLLARASGRTCYNLDGWMTSRDYVCRLFARATAGADIAVVEGVMGMFDGASPATLEGSTAEIAAWLDAPLLLVAGAHGAARSLAATVKGFAEFEPGIRVAGVIANQGGSDRHRAWLAEALAAAGLPPLLGAVPRGAIPTLPSRHLGLVAADPQTLATPILEQLADAIREHVDVPAVIALAQSAAACGFAGFAPPPCEAASGSAFRLGLAWDDAFQFYYADNLEAFSQRGVEICRFSPLADAGLPAGLDGLYFGGGYPELHAARLAENRAMLAGVRAFAASGRPVYAECGGLMYLGRSLTTCDGVRHAMAGAAPLETAMLPRLKTLGYAEVSLQADSLWGPAGAVCRGHEFHYSEIAAADGADDGWRPAYTLRRPRGGSAAEGFARGNILASYVHLHWASRPEVIDGWLARWEASR
jgi:cobyrinic acid a,c-diamide synthase